MAYDEDLAYRIRELVAAEHGVEEKRMFGGLAFLINGNMSVVNLSIAHQVRGGFGYVLGPSPQLVRSNWVAGLAGCAGFDDRGVEAVRNDVEVVIE